MAIDKKQKAQQAMAALALCLAAGNAAPAVAEEIDLQTLQLLREESVSEADFFAAFGERTRSNGGGGTYSRSGITAGNYSRSGLTNNNYSRSGLTSSNYSRSGLTSSNYSRSGITNGSYSRSGLTGPRATFEENGGAAMPAPSVVFEEQT